MINKLIMGKYSIKDLEKLSNIKAHTIRIWEKRYNLISPERTDTNIRYYGDKEVRKLLNVSILNNNGIKISQIADLSENQVNSKVQKFLTTSSEFENHIQFLAGNMMELDEQVLQKKLTHYPPNSAFIKLSLK